MLMPPDDDSFIVPNVLQQMQVLLETLSPIREMVLGYRQQYIDAGVNQTDADHIAAALHDVMMKGIANAQDEKA